MGLTQRDKMFLMKSMKNVKRIAKIFRKSLTQEEMDLINSLEPAIKNDSLSVSQIDFLIKNMENVYRTTPNKFTKELIQHLKELKVEKEAELNDDVEYRFNEDALKTE